MRALITGAQGFTGRYVIAHWLNADTDVELFGLGRSAFDTDSFAHRITKGSWSIKAPLTTTLANAAQNTRYRYYRADLLRRSALSSVLSDICPRVIIHLASCLRDDTSENLFKTNVLGMESLYEAVVASGAPLPCILVASSGSIYGAVNDEHIPIAESQPPSPFDMYSISKCAQESVARMLGHRFGIPTTIARIFNIVGPGQDERHLCGWLAAQIASIEAGDQSLDVRVGPLTTTRDFVDVRDVAEALVGIAVRGEEGTTYNIGSGRETPVRQVYDELVSLIRVAKSLRIKQHPGRKSDMPRNVAQISRLEALGIMPRFTLRQSLADLLDYYRCLFHGSRSEQAASVEPCHRY